MNITTDELFELCKQVYEAFPEWVDTDKVFSQRVVGRLSTPKKWQIRARDSKQTVTVPLYTSDFLLEKLPQFLTIDGYDCRLEISPGGYGRKYKTPNYKPKRPYVAFWCALYTDIRGMIPKLKSGDTPLKALLRLTLALQEAKLL